ncbi:MAG TPA: hypothetical protein VNW15_14525 [Rhizomicrobium sp.]|jgi:hypothetical protein|nr:hypothetical protein [Rhizomicrobium sp.]
MPRSVSGFSLVIVLLASAAPARGADALNGWGDFRFGMSPEQARAVPGQAFGRFSAKNILNQNDGAMASKKPAMLYGIPYTFDLLFNAFQALNRISMWNENTISRAECETRFLTLVPQLEKSYGALLPVYPERKKNNQDQLPISLEWKNTAGASRYQLATVYMGGETAYVWNARKVFDRGYVDAAAVWSAPQEDSQAVCLMELDFKS